MRREVLRNVTHKYWLYFSYIVGVAEKVYASDLKSDENILMWVQIPPSTFYFLLGECVNMKHPQLLVSKMTDASSGITQEDENIEGLFKFDQQKLLDSVEKRSSIYFLKDLIEKLDGCPEEYWLLMLSRVIRFYHMTPLKIYLSEYYDVDVKMETIKLLLFLKGDFLDFLFKNRITNFNYSEFLKLVNEKLNLSPFFFRVCMVNFDKESYSNFIERIKIDLDNYWFYDEDESLVV